jgi:hypothetical protein
MNSLNQNQKQRLAAQAIKEVGEEIVSLLLQKNESYGNSAFDPVRVFCKASASEQISVRIDDKLSRLMRGGEYPGEDTEADLLGYLILKRAAKRYDELLPHNDEL